MKHSFHKHSALLAVFALLLAALSSYANEGTDFWISGVRDDYTLIPTDGDPIRSPMSITILSRTRTNFHLEASDLEIYGVVAPGSPRTIQIPYSKALENGNNIIENKGIHITTEASVVVIVHSTPPNPDEAHSNDAYLALPTHALGTSHIIVTHHQVFANHPGRLNILAVEDNTVISVLDRENRPTVRTLNTGQIFQLQNSQAGQSFQGYRVLSSKPVAVHASIKRLTWPLENCCGDFIVEQMLPVEYWGTDYMGVPLPTVDHNHGNCQQTLLFEEYYHVMARDPDTHINVSTHFINYQDCSGKYFSSQNYTLGAGQSMQVSTHYPVRITSDKPIAVSQIAPSPSNDARSQPGDPSHTTIIPTSGFLKRMRVSSLPIFQAYTHYIQVVAPASAINEVTIDGLPIDFYGKPILRESRLFYDFDFSTWNAFPSIPGFPDYFCRIVVVPPGEHVVSCPQPIGVYPYGATEAGSYGYPGGINTPIPPGLYAIKVSDTVSTTANRIDMDSFVRPPFSIIKNTDNTTLVWPFPRLLMGESREMTFDVLLDDLVPDERRLVTRKTVLTYQDNNFSNLTNSLGSYYVNISKSPAQLAISTDKPSYLESESAKFSIELNAPKHFWKKEFSTRNSFATWNLNQIQVAGQTYSRSGSVFIQCPFWDLGTVNIRGNQLWLTQLGQVPPSYVYRYYGDPQEHECYPDFESDCYLTQVPVYVNGEPWHPGYPNGTYAGAKSDKFSSSQDLVPSTDMVDIRIVSPHLGHIYHYGPAPTPTNNFEAIINVAGGAVYDPFLIEWTQNNNYIKPGSLILSKTTSGRYQTNGVASYILDGDGIARWGEISYAGYFYFGTTNHISFRTRSAPTRELLASAAFSAAFIDSGTLIPSEPSRFLEVEVRLKTPNDGLTPVLENFNVSYNNNSWELQVSVDDAQNSKVANVSTIPLLDSDFGALRTFDTTFNTATTVPGAYKARVDLVEVETGRNTLTATNDFAILSIPVNQSMDASVFTDKLKYNGSEQVVITSRVKNTSVNSSLENLSVLLVVKDLQGSNTFHTFSYTIPSLLQQSLNDKRFSFASQSLPPNQYVVYQTVTSSSAPALNKNTQTSFEVLPSISIRKGISGTISVNPPLLQGAGNLDFQVSARNTGNVPLTNVLFNVDVVDPYSFTSMLNHSGTRNLPVGENTINLTFTSANPSLQVGSYPVTLSAAFEFDNQSYELPLDVSGFSVTRNPIDAQDNSASTSEDQFIDVAVLNNDLNLTANTVISSVTQGANGSVSILPEGLVRYSPASNFNGTDSFTYTISLANELDTATVTVTVLPVNDAPVAANDAASTAEDESVQINVLANDTDVDGDSLTILSVSGSTHGTLAIESNLVRYTPSLNLHGTDSFTYTVSDGQGGEASATVSILVEAVNDAPVALNDTAATDEDTAVLIDVLANDSDTDSAVDGDTLTISAVSGISHGSLAIVDNKVRYTPSANYHGPDSFSYTISDGKGGEAIATVNLTVLAVNDTPVAQADTASTPEDTSVLIDVLSNDSDVDTAVDGDVLTIASVSGIGHGSLSIVDNQVQYTPSLNYHGPDSFTYIISDGNGGEATATVNLTVTAVNDAPVALNDTAATDEDTAVVIDVLANDSDTDTAVDGDVLTITAVSGIAHGTLAIVDNKVRYTPSANYHGSDSFSYTISDGKGGEATASVNLTVLAVNDTPVAQADTASTPEDTAVLINVLSNDSDVDSAVDGDVLTIISVSGIAHGTLDIVDNKVQYTPSANYHGADSFTYTISDGNGGEATATVNLTVTAVNDAPVALNDTASTDEDTTVLIDVLANDSDIDTAVDGDTLTITSVSGIAHGSLAIADNKVQYTPSANYHGPDSFTYTISDGKGGEASASANLIVAPVNDAPVAVHDFVTASEDTAVVIDVLANDSDIDGDSINVTAIIQGAHGTATLNPDNSITYQPELNYNGSDSFTYTITDGFGGNATTLVNVTIQPVNDTPVANPANVEAMEDQSMNITLSASDLDGDSLTYSVTPPTWGTLTGTAPNLVYTPDLNYFGFDAFTFTVNDGSLTSPAAEILIEVLPINDTPIVNAEGPYQVNEGSSVLVSASATDIDDPLVDYSWDLDLNGTFESAGQSVYYPAVDGPATIMLNVKAEDTSGLFDVDDTLVEVLNMPPVCGTISAPSGPMPVNQLLSFSTPFTDPGVNDTHTGLWNWGNGTCTNALISETSGSGTASAQKSYSTAGVYTLSLTVTDKDGASAQKLHQYLVIYDPSAGYIGASGWFNSPAGAYAANPSLTGTINFGMSCKYSGNATIPDGQTEINFGEGNMNFHSENYYWMVVNGSRAQYSGTGTINGSGNYTFIITVIDPDAVGLTGPDKVRIKIWNTATGAIVYDSQPGADSYADPTLSISGGNVRIRR